LKKLMVTVRLAEAMEKMKKHWICWRCFAAAAGEWPVTVNPVKTFPYSWMNQLM
jgi:hypothetical protein